MARPSQRSSQRSSQTLSPRMQRVLREARALLIGFAALLLAAMLLTHTASDPGFSTTGDGTALHNLGGPAGAKLSDVLLWVFGLSAWWWVVLALFYAGYTFRHLDEIPLAGTRQRWFRLAGFALLLVGSMGLEWLRLWHWPVSLPDAHGGVLGMAIGGAAYGLLGFIGGTLFLLLAMAVGFSLFTGVSWLDMVERVGTGLEWLAGKILRSWQAHSDRKLGEAALQKREAVLAVEKKRLVEATPIRIEPVVKGVPQSERAIVERQAPLFSDMPDSPLPPLHR